MKWKPRCRCSPGAAKEESRVGYSVHSQKAQVAAISLRQACLDIRSCSHCLLQFDSNKSVTSCQQAE